MQFQAINTWLDRYNPQAGTETIGGTLDTNVTYIISKSDLVGL